MIRYSPYLYLYTKLLVASPLCRFSHKSQSCITLQCSLKYRTCSRLNKWSHSGQYGWRSDVTISSCSLKGFGGMEMVWRMKVVRFESEGELDCIFWGQIAREELSVIFFFRKQINLWRLLIFLAGLILLLGLVPTADDNMMITQFTLVLGWGLTEEWQSWS